MAILWACIIAGAIALTGCQALSAAPASENPSSIQQAIPPSQPADYRIRPGDVLEISTPTAPELSRTVKVTPDGWISLPLSGRIAADGLSLDQLERRLSETLAKELKAPRVIVGLRAPGAEP